MQQIHRYPVVPFLLMISVAASAQIDVYFNRPVDTSLAYPPGNIARGEEDFSMIVAQQLARARHSIDIAIYSLNLRNIADELIAAKKRGVRVRVIGHLENLDDRGALFRELEEGGIPVTANPEAADGEQQPLMHNKFFVIDARPGAPADADPVTITGSWNATSAQTYQDANNLVVIHDAALAGAYLTEFEEMWGSRGATPSIANGRFGADKTSNTPHEFTLADGTRLEMRFSPSDSTSRRINALLGGAEHAIYAANLTFTYATFARTLRRRHDAGADVRSIIDNIDDQGSQFPFLQSFADIHAWTLPGFLHHKYAVVDAAPGEGTGEALVITGSHNWSLSAETRNDENTLMIFSDRIANQYVQEFAARYREAGGREGFRLITGAPYRRDGAVGMRAYPNPFTDHLTIAADLRDGEHGQVVLIDAMGRELARDAVSAGRPVATWSTGGMSGGVYIALLRAGERSERLRLILLR